MVAKGKTLKMKIYIASSYQRHSTVNNKIFDTLKTIGYTVFLPESIGIDALSADEQFNVSEKCFHEIDDSDIIIAVYPFGLSVSSEIGYAIGHIRNNDKKCIIMLNISEKPSIIHTEAMIMPYIRKEVFTIQQLVEYIKTLDNKK